MDLKRVLDSYRAQVGEFRVLDVAPHRYLAIDGHGDPNTEVFADAAGSLYPVAYALKFASRSAGRDHVVPPLEGLWWAEDLGAFTTARDKTRWCWTLGAPPRSGDARSCGNRSSRSQEVRGSSGEGNRLRTLLGSSTW